MCAAVRRASAMQVTIGFTPSAVGNALVSSIHTPGVSCSSPVGPATLGRVLPGATLHVASTADDVRRWPALVDEFLAAL